MMPNGRPTSSLSYELEYHLGSPDYPAANPTSIITLKVNTDEEAIKRARHLIEAEIEVVSLTRVITITSTTREAVPFQ